ncbi:unnamed protein product [Closterium sp. NIES-64]|nr:unnamed protein product [Closterium sp. NIES-64]
MDEPTETVTAQPNATGSAGTMEELPMETISLSDKVDGQCASATGDDDGDDDGDSQATSQLTAEKQPTEASDFDDKSDDEMEAAKPGERVLSAEEVERVRMMLTIVGDRERRELEAKYPELKQQPLSRDPSNKEEGDEDDDSPPRLIVPVGRDLLEATLGDNPFMLDFGIRSCAFSYSHFVGMRRIKAFSEPDASARSYIASTSAKIRGNAVAIKDKLEENWPKLQASLAAAIGESLTATGSCGKGGGGGGGGSREGEWSGWGGGGGRRGSSSGGEGRGDRKRDAATEAAEARSTEGAEQVTIVTDENAEGEGKAEEVKQGEGASEESRAEERREEVLDEKERARRAKEEERQVKEEAARKEEEARRELEALVARMEKWEILFRNPSLASAPAQTLQFACNAAGLALVHQKLATWQQVVVSPAVLLDASLALAVTLPARLRTSPWRLLYSTARDGIRCLGVSPTRKWRPMDRYYGNGECFVFQVQPSVLAYRWARTNSYFMLSSNAMLAVGGGNHHSLLLYADLLTGASAPCDTFGQRHPCQHSPLRSPFPMAPFPMAPFPMAPFPMAPFPMAPFPMAPFPMAPFPMAPRSPCSLFASPCCLTSSEEFEVAQVEQGTAQLPPSGGELRPPRFPFCVFPQACSCSRSLPRLAPLRCVVLSSALASSLSPSSPAPGPGSAGQRGWAALKYVERQCGRCRAAGPHHARHVAISFALALALLPHAGVGWQTCLLVAACLTPTDPVLASTAPASAPTLHVAGGERGKRRHGTAVRVTSHRTAAAAHSQLALTNWLAVSCAYQVGLAIAAGMLYGLIARVLLLLGDRYGLIDEPSFLAHIIGLALGALGLVRAGAGCVRGNNRLLKPEPTAEEGRYDAINGIEIIVTITYFTYFGAFLPFAAWRALGIPRLLLFSALVLLLRRLPVLLALAPCLPELHRQAGSKRAVYCQAGFAGFFGPIGVGAVLYAAQACEELGGDATAAHVVLFVVVASVVVHGVTASPLSRLLSSCIKRAEEEHRLQQQQQEQQEQVEQQQRAFAALPSVAVSPAMDSSSEC